MIDSKDEPESEKYIPGSHAVTCLKDDELIFNGYMREILEILYKTTIFYTLEIFLSMLLIAIYHFAILKC